MSDTKPVATLTLNPNAAIDLLYKKLEECADSILFGLQIIELVKEIPPYLKIEGGFLTMYYGKIEQDFEKRKEKYRNWLIKKGFEDIVKGIECSLREAYLYVSILSKSSEIKTIDDFNKIFPKIKKKAFGMHIPNMMEKIEPHLIKPWSYKKQILSINKGRNCLVHRDGVITEKDINDETENAFKLEWVKMKIFYEEKGKEKEIIGGESLEGGTIIKMKREDNTICFKRGERIVINYKQFNELLATCNYYAADLVDCLPKEIKRS